MKGIGTAVAVCTILLASMADAATDIPGNKNTKVKLPTGSAGIDGDLFGVGDSDWYKVQLDKGYNYGVLVDAYCPATVLRLLDRDGRQLGTAKGFFDLPAFISWQTIYSGLYYIEVKATGIYVDCEESYYGGFTLSAFRECGPDARTRCTLELGKPSTAGSPPTTTRTGSGSISRPRAPTPSAPATRSTTPSCTSRSSRCGAPTPR